MFNKNCSYHHDFRTYNAKERGKQTYNMLGSIAWFIFLWEHNILDQETPNVAISTLLCLHKRVTSSPERGTSAV